MYMLVFVTLIVAVIGGYAQMYTAMVGRMMAQQSGVGDAMFQWHAAAVGLASNLVSPNTISVGICSLTPPGYGNLSGMAQCSKTTATAIGSIYVSMPLPASYSYCNNGAGGGTACVTSLPQGYLVSPYTFYSVAFVSSGNYYVLTYVPPPTQTTNDKYSIGLLCLPGDLHGTAAGCLTAGGVILTQIPTTFNALYKQLAKNANLSPGAYGTVTASGLTTGAVSMNYGGGSAPSILTYSLPASTNIPVGSIGIITQIVPCTAC